MTSYTDWLQRKQARKEPKKKQYPLKRTGICRNNTQKSKTFTSIKQAATSKKNSAKQLGDLALKSANPKPRKGIKKSNKNAAYNDAFYHYKWNSVPDGQRKCAECGFPIPDEYNAGYVSHWLTKRQIPKLKLTPAVLVFSQFHCRDHHTQWDSGDRKSMASWNEDKHCELQYLYYVLKGYKPPRN